MDSCQLFQQIDTLADKIMTAFEKEVHSNPTSHLLWYTRVLLMTHLCKSNHTTFQLFYRN